MDGQLGKGVLVVGVAVAIFTAGYLAGRGTAPRPRVVATPAVTTAADVQPAPAEPADPLAELATRTLEDAAQLLALPTESQRLDALDSWTANVAPSYALVKRGPANFIGSRVEIHGRALEVRDSDQGAIMRVATRGYEDIYWVEVAQRPDEHVVDRARVRVYGYLANEHTYGSQAGWTITLPVIYAVGVVEERQMAAHLRRRP